VLTAAEQFLLELVNRARLDPGGEAARQGIDLNAGLAPGTLDGAPRQPLAANAALTQAARDHGDWMIASDVFSHDGAGGSTAFERIAAAGYDAVTAGENLALYRVLPGPVDGDAAIEVHHDGLFESPSHRTNLLHGPYREVGIGQRTGPWTIDGAEWSASVAVEKFGAAGTGAFLTGVAYVAPAGAGGYAIGSGAAGVAVAAAGTTATTAAAGGYALALGTAPGWSAVEIGAASARVRLTGENVKLDHVVTPSGAVALHASADLELVAGATRAVLLGAGDLSAVGTGARDHLAGNGGANVLEGGGRRDTLVGGAGDDLLDGGTWGDRLWAGAGADTVRGGEGRDRLWGGSGDDSLDGGTWGDRLWGGPGDDTLRGGDGRDSLWGGPGGDSLDGGTWADALWGGRGDDTASGDAGPDRLHGGAGRDALDGGDGPDTLEGAWGADTLTGGAGGDTFVFAGAWGADTITDFDPAADSLQIALAAGEAGDAAAFRAAVTASADGAVYDAGGDGENAILFAGLDAGALDGASFAFV